MPTDEFKTIGYSDSFASHFAILVLAGTRSEALDTTSLQTKLDLYQCQIEGKDMNY